VADNTDEQSNDFHPDEISHTSFLINLLSHLKNVDISDVDLFLEESTTG
jgi:hypothetical protein